jgi:ribosomal protein S18 acetylase RimI-like enzyme
MAAGNADVNIAPPAGQDDLAHVVIMHIPVWQQSYHGIVSPEALNEVDYNPNEWLARYQTDLEGGHGMLIAKAKAGATVGMAVFHLIADDEVEIDSLYIASDCQRKGIGRSLVDAVVARYPSSFVIVRCADRNIKARNAYASYGFRFDGSVEPYLIGDDVVPMVRYVLDALKGGGVSHAEDEPAQQER